MDKPNTPSTSLLPSTNSSYASIEEYHPPSIEPIHSDRKLGSASFISCVANLSNTILGTGMLAMAHGFAQGGLLIGIITVLVCGSMAYLGLYLLACCAAHPAIPHRRASFFEISKLTYPQASILFDLAIAVKCFGVSISYLLIFGRLIPQVILSFRPASIIGSDQTAHWILDRKVWITLSMIVLAPVSFLPTLDSLRHVSYVALIGVFNLITVVIYKFCFERPLPSSNSGAEIRWVKLDSDFLTALPLFIFAYTCAQNLFSVHNEMIINSARQMKAVLFTCIGSAVGTYEIVGVLGYLTFGSKVSSNLIADYQNSIFVAITRLTVSILVLFSYPLQLYPCRASLMKVLNHRPLDPRRETQDPSSSHAAEDEEGQAENDGLISSTTGEDDHDGHQDRSSKLFVAITAFLLITSFLIAIRVERLEIVLGFVGSTGSTTISYILPGLFFLKLFPKDSVDDNLDKPNLRRRPAHPIDPSDHCRDTSATEDNNIDASHDVGGGQFDLMEIHLLRKLAGFLVLAGLVIMLVCLSLNIHDAFF